MKEIEFIGPTMALEHASFQMFKNVGYQIGIITPNLQLHNQVKQELLFNLKAIDSHSLDRIIETQIILSNGSKAIFSSKRQLDNSYRGYAFNMIFAMYEPIPYEIKLNIIPCLITDPNSILYTVYDRRR